jgi:hypothetical protein
MTASYAVIEKGVFRASGEEDFTSIIPLSEINNDNLHIYNSLIRTRKCMYNQSVSCTKFAKMLDNRNNPKTMDYMFLELLDVRLQYHRYSVKDDDAVGGIEYNGRLQIGVQSNNSILSEAFSQLNSVNKKNKTRGQVYFTMSIFKDQIFPKSRNFRIISRRSQSVTRSNPKAGETKQVKYGSGYVAHYVEPNFFSELKPIILYCRNAWDRKTKIKIGGKRKTKTAEVVEVAAQPAEAI